MTILESEIFPWNESNQLSTARCVLKDLEQGAHIELIARAVQGPKNYPHVTRWGVAPGYDRRSKGWWVIRDSAGNIQWRGHYKFKRNAIKRIMRSLEIVELVSGGEREIGIADQYLHRKYGFFRKDQ